MSSGRHDVANLSGPTEEKMGASLSDQLPIAPHAVPRASGQRISFEGHHALTLSQRFHCRQIRRGQTRRVAGVEARWIAAEQHLLFWMCL
jgi:hypothetical protein